MTDEPKQSAQDASAQFEKLVEALIGRLTERARAAMISVRGGVSDFEDAVQSVVRSLLAWARQGGGGEAVHALGSNEVWELLKKRLKRKLNTYRARTQRASGAGPRLGDAPNADVADVWKQRFLDRNLSSVYDEADAIQSYLRDATSELKDLVNNPELLAVAELRCQDYTQREIAQLLGLTVGQVAHRVRRLLEAMQRALDHESHRDA